MHRGRGGGGRNDRVPAHVTGQMVQWAPHEHRHDGGYSGGFGLV